MAAIINDTTPVGNGAAVPRVIREGDAPPLRPVITRPTRSASQPSTAALAAHYRWLVRRERELELRIRLVFEKKVPASGYSLLCARAKEAGRLAAEHDDVQRRRYLLSFNRDAMAVVYGCAA